MNVFIQAIGKDSGTRLKSAPFILKGSRRKDPDASLQYLQEKADENPPPAPAPATTMPAPAPAPAPAPPVPTLTPFLAQDLQPTTVHYNQDQGNRANPPPPTQNINTELPALTETPGVPTCFEGFSSVEDGFSFLGQEPGNDPWYYFRSGRIDN